MKTNPGRVHRMLFLLALLSSAFVPPAAAQSGGVPPFIGPIRIRDLSPISMLRLDFVPAHACSDDGSLTVLRVNHSEANVFIVSDAAASYLEQRRVPAPLQTTDIEALSKQPGDFFIFDAELAVTDVELIRALSRRTQLRIEWPIVSRGGGFLDRGIETFHAHSGLNSADRDLIARNDVNIAARINGAAITLLGRGTHATSGDPTISLGHTLPVRPGVDLVVEAAAKIALGGERGFFSSGATDFGLQTSIEKRSGRHAFYGGVNLVRVGDGRVFRMFRLSNSVTAIAAWERRVGTRSWIVAQTTWSRETLKPATHSPLDDDRIQVSAGVRRVVAPRTVATIALTENAVHYKNTPDIGVHASLAWIVSR